MTVTNFLTNSIITFTTANRPIQDPLKLSRSKTPSPRQLQGHGDVGSDKANDIGDKDGEARVDEANDEDGKG